MEIVPTYKSSPVMIEEMCSHIARFKKIVNPVAHHKIQEGKHVLYRQRCKMQI